MNNLFELLLVLFIVSILLMAAVPSGRKFLVEKTTATAINSLVAGLNFARSEAIHRSEKLLFCKSSNHKTCGGNWADGQLVVNHSGVVLKVLPAIPKAAHLAWNSSGGKDDFLEWLPTGYTNGQRGTFYYTAPGSQANSQAIVVLNTGRISVQ